jgi:aldose 1-epimerase
MNTVPPTKLRLASLLVAGVLACASTTGSAQSGGAATSAPFGQTGDGKPIELYTLSNQHGMKVAIATYGATVINLIVPDRSGKPDDVALGFDTIQPYFTQSPFFGSTIGRYANRIAKGRFQLDGQTYQIPIDDPPSALHGGPIGFDKQVWKARVVSSSPASVVLTLHSPDGDQGFPGNLDVSVTFTVTEQNELQMLYQATTDKPTVINLTNHTYFNLAGAGNGNILAEILRINADQYTPGDETQIPTGEIKSVADTIVDFRTPKPIGARLAVKDPTSNPIRYNENYVLNQSSKPGLNLAAELYDPESGRVLQVLTDQPGLEFYTASFLNGMRGKGGKLYEPYYAVCLETQHYPDSPNHSNFPSTVLRPGETYNTETIYRFSTR